METTAPQIVETAQQQQQQQILQTGHSARQNPKIGKSTAHFRALGIETRPSALYLVPARMSGVNVCSDSTVGCRAVCVTHPKKGFGRIFSTITQSRLERSKRFTSDPRRFILEVAEELQREVRLAARAGAQALCRLNMASDIDWPNLAIFHGIDLFGELGIMPELANVHHYNYTKSFRQLCSKRPRNYHLTFSRSETNSAKCVEALESGHSVAVVFCENPENYGTRKSYQTRLPETWKLEGMVRGVPVIDGDAHDFRCFDEPGVIVGLRMKGTESEVRHALRTGFAVYCGGNR